MAVLKKGVLALSNCVAPYALPTIAQFQTQFVRDFPYGTDMNVNVLDQDITNAFTQATMTINQGMWSNQTNFTYGYLLLAAHFLVLTLRSSSQGINGQYNFLQSGKGAGSVNESFGIPERITNNPDLAMYCKTNYGAQYLQLLWPQLVGQCFNAIGRTKP